MRLNKEEVSIALTMDENRRKAVEDAYTAKRAGIDRSAIASIISV